MSEEAVEIQFVFLLHARSIISQVRIESFYKWMDPFEAKTSLTRDNETTANHVRTTGNCAEKVMKPMAV